MKPNKAKIVTSWILQIITAAILAQTLFFKFSGSEESKYIFNALGAEPWGRVATGLAELVAVILLIAPLRVTLGALLSLGLMIGAIGSHLTRLGIIVKNDGGLLFGLAVTVLVCSAAILVLRRRQILVLSYALVPAREIGCPAKDGQH
jgi:hypothetical protein